MESMRHSCDAGNSVRSPQTRNNVLGIRHVTPVYRVGELFHRGRRSWPEGTQLSHGPSGYELTLVRSNIDSWLEDDVRRAQAEFALIVELPVIVLAYRFGESSCRGDVPYSWHLQPPRGRAVPSLEGSSQARAFLWITLVSTSDGVIKAQRGLTLSPDFTRILNAAVRAQAMMPFNSEECTSAISKVYLTHSSPISRWSSAIARTMGNE
jgi:hypothetical protein